ncbi:MAG: hypothetical protein HOK35_05400 [Cytophagia bacterium]|jgi:hypothetical protein|nr:hypothetical protein [Cytophagia bacterium]
MMNNYYFITDFRNLSNYLSLGFISPNHISYLTSKYYHIPINSWKETVLYKKENIPQDLPDSAVIIALEDILDKNKYSIKMRGNFCKEKNGNIIVGKLNKYQNYLPITFIYKIIFSNNDIKERFKQMEYTNTFDLEDYQLEINNRFHLNSTSEDCLEKDPDRGDNFKLKIYEFEKFDFDVETDFKKSKFNSELTFHYIIADYALSNNIYNNELDCRIPAKYKQFNKSNSQTALISALLKLSKIDDKKIPNNLFHSMATISDDLIETDIFLWYAIFYNLKNIEHKYKIEEVEINYIDQIMQFKFDRENIKDIGKHLKKMLINNVDNENLKSLANILQNIDFLDIKRNSIFDKIKNNGSQLSIMIFNFLMDLISYSNQIRKLRSIYIDKPSKNIEDLLIKFLFYQYIGFSKIPKKVKQSSNWKFILDSFICSDYVSIHNKLQKIDRESYLSKIRRTFRGDRLYDLDSSKKSIKINKQNYIFNYQDIYVTQELDKYKVMIPVKDKYGITYTYIDFLDSKDNINVGYFEKYLKTYQEEEYSKMLENKYQSMSYIDKMKFLSYSKAKSP